MAALWDRVRKSLREVGQAATEKTEEGIKIGRRKLEIANINRKIEKSFAELGGRVYQMLEEQKKADVASDEEVQTLITRIKELEKSTKSVEREIERIKGEKEEKKTSK
jgi:archaellum component FlaC